MFKHLHRIPLATTILLIILVRSLHSQPNFSAQIMAGGTSMTWLSFMVEANVHSFDEDLSLQSIRVATGYGIPMFNAAYVPLEMRCVMFRGESHLDIIAGMNLQVKYTEPNNDGWKDFQSSLLNPTAALCYRYERETGGLSFRFGIGGMYAVNDDFFMPSLILGIGTTF